MAELKNWRNETLGEISLLGKPATNLDLQKIVSLEMNVQQSLQNTLKKNVKPFTKESKNTFTL